MADMEDSNQIKAGTVGGEDWPNEGGKITMEDFEKGMERMKESGPPEPMPLPPVSYESYKQLKRLFQEIERD
jgi:hypothetical protein